MRPVNPETTNTPSRNRRLALSRFGIVEDSQPPNTSGSLCYLVQFAREVDHEPSRKTRNLPLRFSNSRGLCLRVRLAEAQQRTDEFFVVTPAPARTPIDFLSHLPEARCHYGAVGLVKIQAAFVPFEPEEIQHSA